MNVSSHECTFLLDLMALLLIGLSVKPFNVLDRMLDSLLSETGVGIKEENLKKI